MIRAAGIMLLHKGPEGDRILFLQRRTTVGDTDTSDHPGEWCFPGGTVEGNETLEECALRETEEEIGPAPFSNPKLWTRRVGAIPPALPSSINSPLLPTEIKPQEEVDFTTFIAVVRDQFVPVLNNEHDAYTWAPPSAPPEPLHPGCRVALARLTMDELGIARAIVAGELASPQQYANFWLFAIRITGTGAAYRIKDQEFVWRDASLYLNDDFLARCNGLPVVVEHSQGIMLSPEEYHDQNVGSVFLPYIKGEDVWAVVKIWNPVAAEMMMERQLSTSPAVVFRESNPKVELASGDTLLIEGLPSLLDHVAICKEGVWDKGGAPTGIDIGRSDDQPDVVDEPADIDWPAVLSHVRRVKLEIFARHDAQFNEADHPRVQSGSEAGQFTSGGGSSDRPKIAGSGKKKDELQKALSAIPAHHFELAGPLEIEHNNEVRNSAGKPVQGLAQNYKTHHKLQVGSEQVKDPVGTLTHEVGHAIFNRHGATPELVATVKAEADKLPPSDKYLAAHYLQSDRELFSELYKLAYSPSKKGAFAMGQKGAEKRFSRSLELLKSYLEGKSERKQTSTLESVLDKVHQVKLDSFVVNRRHEKQKENGLHG